MPSFSDSGSSGSRSECRRKPKRTRKKTGGGCGKNGVSAWKNGAFAEEREKTRKKGECTIPCVIHENRHSPFSDRRSRPASAPAVSLSAAGAPPFPFCAGRAVIYFFLFLSFSHCSKRYHPGSLLALTASSGVSRHFSCRSPSRQTPAPPPASAHRPALSGSRYCSVSSRTSGNTDSSGSPASPSPLPPWRPDTAA